VSRSAHRPSTDGGVAPEGRRKWCHKAISTARDVVFDFSRTQDGSADGAAERQLRDAQSGRAGRSTCICPTIAWSMWSSQRRR
jgi:hypothetical protein